MVVADARPIVLPRFDRGRKPPTRNPRTTTIADA
jgi:hypothetical protein